MSEFSLQGITWEDVEKMVNKALANSEAPKTFAASYGGRRYDYAGDLHPDVNLRVRIYETKDGVMEKINILGEGWMLNFFVRRTSRNLDKVKDLYWPINITRPGEAKKAVIAYRPTFLSPDHFQREMVLVKMFQMI
jgi:hypothetical protein